MKIGLTMMGGSVREAAEAAQLAEAAGFDSVWTAEFYDRSASVSLAAMAQRTSRIELGSAIMYAFGRSPLVLATEARDLDELSGGRFTLGLGTGTIRQAADWLSVVPEHPARRVEELIATLREIWELDRGRVRHDGRYYHVDVYPTLPIRPAARPLRVYLAGVNRRMIEAAGAAADCLVGHPLFTRSYVQEVVRPALAAGARRAGRDEHVPIAGYVLCSVDEDPAAARRAAAAQICLYLAVKSFDHIVVHRNGFGAEVEAIRDALRRHDVDAMTAAVSDKMLEATSVVGTPVEARRQFESRFAGLYDEPLLFPPIVGLDEAARRKKVRALIDTFGPERVSVRAERPRVAEGASAVVRA